MVAWALMASALGSSWVVDGTSLPAHYGSRPVEAAVVCEAAAANAPTVRGEPMEALGIAVVAYSKKQGTMTWGHASLRVQYCLGGELVDAEFEMYRLSAWNEVMLRKEHAGEPFATDPWLTTQRGAKVLFRNVEAVDRGWFGDAQAQNREIYAVWLDLTPEERNRVVVQLEQLYDAQRERFRRREALSERFRMVTNNCTSLFEAVLPERLWSGRPVTPFAWVRQLEERALARVLYPSHYLVRRWGGELPPSSPRMRPVFRWHRKIPREDLSALRASLSGRQPVLPHADP